MLPTSAGCERRRRPLADKGDSYKKSSKNRALRSDACKAHNSQRSTADGGTAKATREESLDGHAEKRAREAKEQAESAALMKKMLTQTPAERQEERRAEVVEQVCRLCRCWCTHLCARTAEAMRVCRQVGIARAALVATVGLAQVSVDEFRLAHRCQRCDGQTSPCFAHTCAVAAVICVRLHNTVASAR